MKSAVWITLIIATALASAASHAQTKPTRAQYGEARKLYDEFDRTISRSMLWEKKPIGDRKAALQQAIAHRDRISKLMGDSSQCSAAASLHVDFISNLNALVAAGEGVGKLKTFDVLGAVSNAEVFGNRRAGCYDEVEALDAPLKK
jgi:hypothetical protein